MTAALRTQGIETEQMTSFDLKENSQEVHQDLLSKYEIQGRSKHIVSKSPRILNILKKLDADQTIREADYIWLCKQNSDIFTQKVKIKYHQIEAAYYKKKYQEKKNEWKAIVTATHLLKCNDFKTAKTFLTDTNIHLSSNKKLLCNYFLLLGQIVFNLNQIKQAIEYTTKAFEQQPTNEQVLTALGTMYIYDGQYRIGHAWYQKAIDRGASPKTIETEIRTIILKTKPSERKNVANTLLEFNVGHCFWLRELNNWL
ncbi:tetratricopeptide repeat protein [Acinetobacter sp. P1(2025)]|uniref:tetratricopeptide repeat protein n=1 Tax=Acinetobacter sp. P1(2025) TaxID=3446120 RepID=UPI003F53035F